MWKINGFEIKGQKYSCPFVFSGSQVIDGHGSMVVAAVGGKTFEGQNKQLLSSSGKKEGEDDEDDANLTPLKKQLNDLSNIIGNLGITFAILIGAVLFTKETILNLYAGIPIFSSRELDILVNAFIIAVTVIVVAIPEGLPMAVTIAFAFSVDKMKKEHNLVKHLDKSEAMGNVNNVCTDKTGTLTLGVMRIAAFFIEDEDIRLNKAKVQDENLRSLIWNCIFKISLVLNPSMTKEKKYLMVI
jgi:Ca2+ transporting ATPase